MKGTVSNKVVWSAADYASNSTVQQTWARELIAQLKLRGNERILDVGCGDGKITAELARSVPSGSVVGIDASPQMIDFAIRKFSIPNLGFRVLDARQIKPDAFLSPSPLPPNRECGASVLPLLAKRGEGWGEEPQGTRRNFGAFSGRVHWEGEARSSFPEIHRRTVSALFDLVFSNAALHWVDDHRAFLRGAACVLRPGGRLILSCGGKGNAHDVFLALRPIIRLKRWREFFRKIDAPYFFHSPDEYKKWLPRFGFKTRSVKLTPKDATYEGREGFAAWLRTTWLPYTQRVPESLREEFIAAVADRYLAKHPPDAKGLVHVRMVRLEIDAARLRALTGKM